jgi:hypothetical protein
MAFSNLAKLRVASASGCLRGSPASGGRAASAAPAGDDGEREARRLASSVGDDPRQWLNCAQEALGRPPALRRGYPTYDCRDVRDVAHDVQRCLRHVGAMLADVFRSRAPCWRWCSRANSHAVSGKLTKTLMFHVKHSACRPVFPRHLRPPLTLGTLRTSPSASKSEGRPRPLPALMTGAEPCK